MFAIWLIKPAFVAGPGPAWALILDWSDGEFPEGWSPDEAICWAAVLPSIPAAPIPAKFIGTVISVLLIRQMELLTEDSLGSRGPCHVL